jgi:tetratricopeptide (TPR) repeat protein
LNSGIINKSANIPCICVYPRSIAKIAILVLTFINLGISAQIPFNVKQKKIDSLFTRLETAQDTAYVNTLNNLSLNLADRNVDSAFNYAQQSLVSSLQTGYLKGEGLAYFNLGNCYYLKMDFKAALEQYFNALKILEPIGPSFELENLYYQMGYVNYLAPNNNRTTDYFHKVLNTSIAIRDSLGGSVGACGELALYYWQNSWNAEKFEYDRLIDSAYKYISMCREFLPNDTTRNLDGLVDVFIIQGVIQQHFSYENAYKSLIRGLHFAFKLKETKAGGQFWFEMNDSTAYDWYIGFCYGNMGDVYLNSEKYHEAEECYSQSLEYYKKTPHIEYISGSYSGLGWIKKEQKEYTRAIQYFKKSEALCDTYLNDENRRKHDPSFTRLRQIFNANNRQVFNYSNLSEIYQQTGNLNKALEYEKKAELQKSKNMMKDYEYQINLLQTNYENENTTQKIALLNSEIELNKMRLSRTRGFLIGTSISALLLVLMIIFYFQRNKLKADQKALILKHKLLRSQMNPHFLYNALAGIQNFIVTEKSDLASLYLLKFSRLVRNILDNSAEELVTLDQELNTIENYLALQSVRYAGIFNYKIDVDDSIDPEMVKIPPMLAQPFIENAIEHGIKYLESGGEINIRLSAEDHILIFEVEDNGVGRNKAHEIESAIETYHQSMATSITRERLSNLNRKLNKKIMLEIIDLKNALGEACGTRVVFGVPLRE